MRAGMSKLVLVVDDDPDVLDAMSLVLVAEGYEVYCASDGTEALTLLNAGLSPALVVTDVMMPDLTGWDLLGAMRADPTLCHVPVVMMTAAFVASCPQGVDLLEKPFDLDALLAIADKFCARPPDGDSPDESRVSSSGRRRTRAA